MSIGWNDAAAQPAAWTYAGQTTRTTLDISFNDPSLAPGTRVWLAAQWTNPRGQRGPLSAPAYAHLHRIADRAGRMRDPGGTTRSFRSPIPPRVTRALPATGAASAPGPGPAPAGRFQNSRRAARRALCPVPVRPTIARDHEPGQHRHHTR